MSISLIAFLSLLALALGARCPLQSVNYGTLYMNGTCIGNAISAKIYGDYNTISFCDDCTVNGNHNTILLATRGDIYGNNNLVQRGSIDSIEGNNNVVRGFCQGRIVGDGNEMLLCDRDVLLGIGNNCMFDAGEGSIPQNPGEAMAKSSKSAFEAAVNEMDQPVAPERKAPLPSAKPAADAPRIVGLGDLERAFEAGVNKLAQDTRKAETAYDEFHRIFNDANKPLASGPKPATETPNIADAFMNVARELTNALQKDKPVKI